MMVVHPEKMHSIKFGIKVVNLESKPNRSAICLPHLKRLFAFEYTRGYKIIVLFPRIHGHSPSTTHPLRVSVN